MSGWISLDRSITKHWLWQNEKFTKGQAWIDLLLHAAHTPNKKLIKGTLIPVSRGEQIRSQLTLANTWNWDRKTVSRFLKLLEKDGMIVSRVDHLTSYVSICNYDSFQNNTGDDTQHKGHLKGQQAPTREDTNNKGNKDNKDNKDNNNNSATSRFNEFWDLYNKKTSRSKCEPKFNKLKESDIDKIFNVLPDYIKSTPEVKYRKNPFTWLNGKCWNDETAPAPIADREVCLEIANHYNEMMPHKPMSKLNDDRVALINKALSIEGMTVQKLIEHIDYISRAPNWGYLRIDSTDASGNHWPAKPFEYYMTESIILKAIEE